MSLVIGSHFFYYILNVGRKKGYYCTACSADTYCRFCLLFAGYSTRMGLSINGNHCLFNHRLHHHCPSHLILQKVIPLRLSRGQRVISVNLKCDRYDSFPRDDVQLHVPNKINLHIFLVVCSYPLTLLPSKHKTFVYYLYNGGTTLRTSGRRCTNGIRMFCV